MYGTTIFFLNMDLTTFENEALVNISSPEFEVS